MRCRYLWLRDFQEIIRRVSGAPLDELATEPLMELAKSALDAPAAEFRSAKRRRTEVHEGIPAKAAVLCRGLLSDPPLRDHAARTAYECLKRFVALNGARVTADGRVVLLRFEEAV